MEKMYEKKKILFYVFRQKNGNYVVDVLPYKKKDFSIFFHTEKQAINFINETGWDDIN